MSKTSNRFIIPFIISIAIAMVCLQAGTALAAGNDSNPVGSTDWSALVPGTDYVDGQVVVTFSDSLTSQDQMYTVAKAHGCEVMKVLSFADWKAGGGKIALLSIPEGTSVPDAITALEKDTLVTCAEPNGIGSSDDPVDSTDWSALVPGTDYVDGQVIVTFSDSLTSQDQMYTVAKAHDCEVIKVLSFADWKAGGGKIALLSVPEGTSVPDAITALEKDALITCAEPNGIGGSDDPADLIWQRIQGADRYFTMRNIAQIGWSDNSCSTVIVASGDDFPDALSGSGLAGIYDCPILLTTPTSLSPQVSSEITRLGAQHVIVLGGMKSISSSVEDSLKTLVGAANVTRIYGSTRYETAKAIYDQGLGSWSSTLIVATGLSSSDALTISAYADATSSPIFLTDGTGGLANSMKTIIQNGTFDKIIIIGGTSSVSADTETWLDNQLGVDNVMRITGDTRYATSSSAATWETGNMSSAKFQPSIVLSYNKVAIANGENGMFADGLAGGELCGHLGSVLLLSPDFTSGNFIIASNIIPNKSNIQTGYTLGGTSTFSSSYEDYLEAVCL